MAKIATSTGVPPLEWLRVFEAAARLGNFTAAAQELNLTQAAVSQRIRNLEARLGVALFVRLPRGVELTTEGEAYAPHVRASFLALERSTTDLFSRPRRQISVAAPASAIELWMIPRLSRLQESMPDLQVSFLTVNRLGDYAAADADLEVRFGDGQWSEKVGQKLYDEVLAPIVAPDLLRTSKSDWRSLPQIAVSGPRDGWLEWAARAKVAPPRSPGYRFDSFIQALAAAKTGTGVLLGSLNLISDWSVLVQLPEPAIRMDDCYWITWPKNAPDSKERHAVIDAFCHA